MLSSLVCVTCALCILILEAWLNGLNHYISWIHISVKHARSNATVDRLLRRTIFHNFAVAAAAAARLLIILILTAGQDLPALRQEWRWGCGRGWTSMFASYSQQPRTYPHPPIPAARLFFVFQCLHDFLPPEEVLKSGAGITCLVPILQRMRTESPPKEESVGSNWIGFATRQVSKSIYGSRHG